jgi:hypothetical protein
VDAVEATGNHPATIEADYQMNVKWCSRSKADNCGQEFAQCVLAELETQYYGSFPKRGSDDKIFLER